LAGEKNGSVPASWSVTSIRPAMAGSRARSSDSMPCRMVTSARLQPWQPPSSRIRIQPSAALATVTLRTYVSLTEALGTAQRSRPWLGILRALGATRRQIRWLFLGESAVTGLVGSLGGLLFGILIARGIAASIGTLLSDVYGVAQRADEFAASPRLLLIALAIGLGTSVVAALIPARNAARVDPVHALQKGKYQVLSAGESRVRIVLAAVLGTISVACLIIPDAVERLMDGQKADMVFTDPPYNVDYEGYTEERLTIEGDRMDAARFSEFLRNTFVSLRLTTKTEASVYVCHSSSWQREFQEALEDAGFEVRCQIIWAKNTFAWGFGRYKFQHEPIFYGHLADEKDLWFGDKSQSTLWQEKKPVANRLHPTMKPIELIERGLVNSSRAGDLVVDLFGGSGSTLIACEKTGRFARLMELDPKYCDVIVRR